MSSADESPTPRIQREPSGPIPTPHGDDTRTGIIRREPTEPEPLSDDTRTSTLDPPAGDGEGFAPDEPTGIMRPVPQRIAGSPRSPSNSTAVAAAAVSIISGWATAVVATDLITAWWRTDRLFCVGVGFLTAVFAASTIAGVVALLLRRRVGIFLTIVAAVLAVMIFAGIFVAGARTVGIVRAIPVLPAAATLLVLTPATWRWCADDE